MDFQMGRNYNCSNGDMLCNKTSVFIEEQLMGPILWTSNYRELHRITDISYSSG